jgi:hypothetical protein
VAYVPPMWFNQNETPRYKEMQHIIATMITALPDDQREIFLLHRTQGLTCIQIAPRKNVFVKTVEKKMWLALRHLHPHTSDATVLLVIAKSLYRSKLFNNREKSVAVIVTDRQGVVIDRH